MFYSIYMRMCAAAIGINLGLICYSILDERLDLLPLAIINILLLGTGFFIRQHKEE